MTQNLRAGIEVTVIGMGLVFLTLIIVMFAIQLLGRIFRGQSLEEAQAEASPPQDTGGAQTPQDATLTAATETSASRLGDEAAAIAVAIALARSRMNQRHAQPAEEEEFVGEVISVATFEASGGPWKSHNRLQAVR